MGPHLWPILAELERRLVQTLLRSPAFHRGVEKVHKNVHRLRHGKLPEDMGGTNVDEPKGKGVKHFFELLWEELKTGHRPESKNKK